MKTEKVINYKKISRNIAISQGAYDGRFRSKIVEDKKKKTSKEACKKKIDF